MSEGASFTLNEYMTRTNFEVILSSICYKDRNNVEYNDGFFHFFQIEESWNMNMDE